jgi:hypothetical protein
MFLSVIQNGLWKKNIKQEQKTGMLIATYRFLFVWQSFNKPPAMQVRPQSL